MSEKLYNHLMKYESNIIATMQSILQTHKPIAVTKEDEDEMYFEAIGLLRDLVKSIVEGELPDQHARGLIAEEQELKHAYERGKLAGMELSTKNFLKSNGAL